ncbi:MAG TPA: IclR family transcriptional regulator [Baekduia sp.]|jgi:IclR family acetate operon transcriptional repressor
MSDPLTDGANGALESRPAMAIDTIDAQDPARRVLSSVANALRVLEYLVEVGESGVSEIGREVGVTVGTSHRLVATLVAAGFVEQNAANRRYRPSRKFAAMAHKVRPPLNARDIAHQYLVDLVGVVDETVNLAILSDTNVLYVDKVTSDRPFGIEAKIGSRLPAYCTALGKVLVSHLEPGLWKTYLKRSGQPSALENAPPPPSLPAYRAELAAVLEVGYAMDAGEYLSDVFCIAAPIVGPEGEVTAALSISAPRSRFEANREHFVAEAQRTAATLSETLSELGLPEDPREFVPAGVSA